MMCVADAGDGTEQNMWTRKELKDKAKFAFKANYWKAVLVGLLLAVLISGFGSFGSFGSVGSFANSGNQASFDGDVPSSVHVHVNDAHNPDDIDIVIDDGDEGIVVHDSEGHRVEIDDPSAVVLGIGALFAALSLLLVFLVVFVLVFAIDAFIWNPLEVGVQRFFLRNLNQPSEVKEVAHAFDTNYRNTVKGLFIRDLCILGWSLLFIIPGIVKSYEYRMMPYLYADDPTMTKERAFAESKQMMTGQKWNAFVLDLSFLGWNILSALTLGFLGIFYVNPYQGQTNAALYEKLRYGLPAPAPMPTAAGPQGYAPSDLGNFGGQQAYAPYDQNQQVYAPYNQSQQTPVPAPTFVPASQPPIPPFAAAGMPAPDWNEEPQPTDKADVPETAASEAEALAAANLKTGAFEVGTPETGESPVAPDTTVA